MVTLDAHVHFQTSGYMNPNTLSARYIQLEDSLNYFNFLQNQETFKNYFFFSEAYLKDNFNEAIEQNILVNELSKLDSKAIGFCSFSLKQKFYLELFQSCLKSEESRGLKLHTSYDQIHLHNEIYFERLDLALSHINKPFIVIIHLNFSKFETKENLNEISAFYKLASKFSHIKFVIAHAANAYPQALKYFSDLDNVYTETSTLFRSFRKNNHGKWFSYYGYSLDEYIHLFRKFGMHKVLYGSDTFLTNLAGTQEIDFINGTNKLSFVEKDMLLHYNGNTILNYLGLL